MSREAISKIGFKRFVKNFSSRRGPFRSSYSRSLGKKRNEAWREKASKSVRGVFELASDLSIFVVDERINKIKERLAEKLPGQDAQYRMAPMHRERIEVEILKVGQYKPSAVMILFCYNSANELFIPLIQRASYKGVHSAQISFPGGKFEEGDGNLENTAIRECFEEIGIKDLEVIGKLTPLYIPVSGFLVEPYVGFCGTVNPAMISQQREVETILKMPLDHLLNDSSIENGNIEIQNKMIIKTNWFAINENKVWGATAMILSELKEAIRGVF